MQAYTTLFDITQKGFPWLFDTGGLIIGALGIVVIRRKKASYKWALGIAAFGILWSLVSFSASYNQRRDALQVYAAGQYLIVEGPVESYQEEPVGKGECFSAQGKRFCYSDFVIVPGFNNAAWHGGPIRPGLPVRVSYVGDTILKLEVRSDMAPSTAEIRLRKLRAIERNAAVLGTFPAIILAINAVLWLYDRLRGNLQSKPVH
jgi:hypothetical protein